MKFPTPILNAFLEQPQFAASMPCAALRQQPLGFIDVGARGGIHDLVLPLAGATAVLGFEPDGEECRRLKLEMASCSPWAKFAVEPWALAEKEGQASLYVQTMSTNSSLRLYNPDFVQRYQMARDHVDTISVPIATLDRLLFEDRAKETNWGEFIKLDTQGTEFEVLQGARRTLAERTVAVFSEVTFFESYRGQKLFSEVEMLLREQGFSFYGFASMHTRACKLLNKRQSAACERAYFADAVFFKDPLPGGLASATMSQRQQLVLFTCAMLLGYYDFALQLALDTWAKDDEAERIKLFVQGQAAQAAAQSVQEARKQMESFLSAPDRAIVQLGRIVDQRRHFSDYDNVL